MFGRVIVMRRMAILLIALIALLSGCMTAGNGGDAPAENSEEILTEDVVPESIGLDKNGVPVLNVYMTDSQKVESMDIETYLMGVVAGEMKNDWPIEALKAQAILARTFTLKFLESKKSSHEGADISTDISEAQAYAADKINDRVKRAVEETRGVVMLYEGKLPQAWFHAHSGGTTEVPSVALDYKEDPEYLEVAASYDSDKAPDDVKSWEAVFTADEIGDACRKSGVATGKCKTFEIGERGGSGRAKTFIINGATVSAPTFRVNIGASKLKSTMLESVEVSDGNVVMKGSGYGHGVGMSQWGAYGLAESGASAQSIVGHYYKGVDFVGLW